MKTQGEQAPYFMFYSGYIHHHTHPLLKKPINLINY